MSKVPVVLAGLEHYSQKEAPFGVSTNRLMTGDDVSSFGHLSWVILNGYIKLVQVL